MKNYLRKLLFICLGLLMAGQCITAKSVKVKNKIDWPSFMQCQDMIWETLPEYWYESAFMGNGMLGLMIYKEPDENYIRLETGRCDVEDHRPGRGCLHTPRLLTGHFALRPQGKILNGTMRLDLWNAETTARINTTQGTIELQALVHADQMVMLVDVRTSEGEQDFRWEWIPADAQSPRYLFSKTKESWFRVDNYQLNPEPLVEPGLSIQKLNAGGETAVAWREKAGKTSHTYYITLTHSFPQSTAMQEAEQNLAVAMKTGFKNLQKQHRAWWHAFYPKSFLTLPDVQKENFYWAQMYKLGSATRGDRALIDNCGPWLAVTPWPNAWWNLNVQLTYWALNASNHLDLAASLENALYNHTDNLKKNLPAAYQEDALGIACTSNLNCLSEEVSDPGKDKGAQIGLLNWACHNLWLIYRHKMDDTLLRNKLFPLLKQATNHYRHFLYRGKDGKLHLPSTYSPEYGNAEDCNFNLALINWGCKTLLEITERLKIEDELIPVWKEILRDLTPYPVKEGEGLMIGHGVPYVNSHRHYSHLLAAYPLYLINRENPEEYKLIDESLKYWQSKPAAHRGYSYTGGASIAAALGKGNDALDYLNKLFDNFGEMNFMSVNTLYRESGPVIETPLSGVQSIHDMLLQSWGGKLRIFPAVPDAWGDVAFRDLRTEGAFLVTASRKEGKTEFALLKSRAGEPCVVVIDMPNPQFEGKRDYEVTALGNNAFKIDLKKGETVVISPKGAKTDFTIEAIHHADGNCFGKKKEATVQASNSRFIQNIKRNYISTIIGLEDGKEQLVTELAAIEPEKEVSDQNIVELQQMYPASQDEVERYIKEQQPDGSWKDINYQDRKHSGWNAQVHANRILLLSKYYSSKKAELTAGQKQDLSNAIHGAMNFWFAKKPVCLNWWYNEIGIPRTLGATFLLMEDEMSEAEKQSAIEVMLKARIGRTGQNKVWLAGNVLIRALLQNDWELVKEARNAIAGEIVTGKKEGIKDDWSFHQHGAQQQFGNYGLAFLSSMGLYSAVFAHTPLAFSPQQQETLTSLLLEGYRWITWRGYWDVNALNRQLFRNADIDKTFWLRFTALSLIKGSDAEIARKIKQMVTETSLQNSGKGGFAGHKHFGDSDYTLHRTDKWMASLRMASTRVIGTELINEDNLKGYYMADGALYTYINGDEYHNIFPLWNWRLIPGITTYLNDAPIPNPYKVDGSNHSYEVGGISHNGNGISAMKLDRNKLRAYKSWVFTQDFILCMGSGIQADSTATLVTTIDQRRYASNEWAQGQKHFHGNTGYIVLQADTCKSSVEEVEGDWSSFMGSYAPRREKGKVYSLYLTHDTHTPASYVYVVLPGATRGQTEQFHIEDIQVLQNTPEAQVVVVKGICYISAYQATVIRLPNKKEIEIPQAGTYMADASKGEVLKGDCFKMGD